MQNASDNLRSAQMSMEDTEDQLNSYTITSPISGTVISKEVKAGDTVSNTAGSTSLCTIYDLSYLQMTVNVDELEILSIKEGQSVTITADAISGRTFTAWSPACPRRAPRQAEPPPILSPSASTIPATCCPA